MIAALLFLCSLTVEAAAGVTLYRQSPLYASTPTASGYTWLPAFDPKTIAPPPLPTPAPPTQFSLQLQSNAAQVSNLSIPQKGSFFGFSIEFSVINQVLGRNSSLLRVPFLNLMSNLAHRSGQVHIRAGGNSQEAAQISPFLPNGTMIAKYDLNLPNQVTPGVNYTTDVFYMLNNISTHVNVKWYLGVPFYDAANLKLGVVEYGTKILGTNLLAIQVGNEPDLYSVHGHRPTTYSPSDYVQEFGDAVQAMADNPNIGMPKQLLLGPSFSGTWTPEMMWSTPFLSQYSSNLAAITFEHYPDNNCYAALGVGKLKQPSDVFSNYLNHTSGQLLVQPYLNSVSVARAAGKPFIMFETNTASCGGFLGVSDSFGAALWGIDYSLQMAYSNFSEALFHVGGADEYFNAFTPPPTNQSVYNQWTVGPLYYAALAVAETLGSSGLAQVVDLQANANNEYTPAYAIYESGQLTKVALLNFLSDPSGASNYTVAISGRPTGVPARVRVKYLSAKSVSDKTNITWAGQTFGGVFESDGRLQGSPNIISVPCDQTANICKITVPAPGFALVFLSDNSLNSVTPPNTATFTTSTFTKSHNTVTVNRDVLATSNGHSGRTFRLGSTSHGSRSGGCRHLGDVPLRMMWFFITLLGLFGGLSCL